MLWWPESKFRVQARFRALAERVEEAGFAQTRPPLVYQSQELAVLDLILGAKELYPQKNRINYYEGGHFWGEQAMSAAAGRGLDVKFHSLAADTVSAVEAEDLAWIRPICHPWTGEMYPFETFSQVIEKGRGLQISLASSMVGAHLPLGKYEIRLHPLTFEGNELTAAVALFGERVRIQPPLLKLNSSWLKQVDFEVLMKILIEGFRDSLRIISDAERVGLAYESLVRLLEPEGFQLFSAEKDSLRACQQALPKEWLYLVHSRVPGEILQSRVRRALSPKWAAAIQSLQLGQGRSWSELKWWQPQPRSEQILHSLLIHRSLYQEIGLHPQILQAVQEAILK